MRLNFKEDIINNFMPSQDGIKRMTEVRYAANGKTEIRRPINELYPTEYNLRKNDGVQLKFVDGKNIFNFCSTGQ